MEMSASHSTNGFATKFSRRSKEDIHISEKIHILTNEVQQMKSMLFRISSQLTLDNSHMHASRSMSTSACRSPTADIDDHDINVQVNDIDDGIDDFDQVSIASLGTKSNDSLSSCAGSDEMPSADIILYRSQSRSQSSIDFNVNKSIDDTKLKLVNGESLNSSKLSINEDNEDNESFVSFTNSISNLKNHGDVQSQQIPGADNKESLVSITVVDDYKVVESLSPPMVTGEYESVLKNDDAQIYSNRNKHLSSPIAEKLNSNDSPSTEASSEEESWTSDIPEDNDERVKESIANDLITKDLITNFASTSINITERSFPSIDKASSDHDSVEISRINEQQFMVDENTILESKDHALTTASINKNKSLLPPFSEGSTKDNIYSHLTNSNTIKFEEIELVSDSNDDQHVSQTMEIYSEIAVSKEMSVDHDLTPSTPTNKKVLGSRHQKNDSEQNFNRDNKLSLSPISEAINAAAFDDNATCHSKLAGPNTVVKEKELAKEPVTIISLASGEFNFKLILNYLTVIDTYSFCTSCKFFFEYFEIPSFEVIISSQSEQNKDISRKELETKCLKINNNLKVKKDYHSKTLKLDEFKRLNFKKLQSDGCKKIINSLTKVTSEVVVAEKAFIIDAKKFSSIDKVDVKIINWSIKDNNKTDNHEEDSFVKLIPCRIPLKCNFGHGRNIYELKGSKEHNLIATDIRQGSKITGGSLSDYDWENVDSTENINLLNFPITDGNYELMKGFCRYQRLKETDFNDLCTKRKRSKVKLRMPEEYSATSSKYFVCLSHVESSMNSKGTMSSKTGVVAVLNCYAYNKNSKSEQRLLWKSNIPGNQLHPAVRNQRLQISNNFLIVQASFDFWLVFVLKTGKYIGFFSASESLGSVEFEDKGKKLPLKLVIRGANVFLELRCMTGNRGASKSCLLSMSLSSFLLKLNKGNRFKVVTVIEAPENVSDNWLNELVSSQDSLNIWNIIFETEYGRPTIEMKADIKHLSMESYFWGDNIALFISENDANNSVDSVKTTDYLMLYDLVTNTNKYINLADSNLEKTGFILADDKLNFVVMSDSFVEVPIY